MWMRFFILCKLCPATTTVPFSCNIRKRSCFCTQSGQTVVKVDGSTSSYKTDRPTAKSDISQKEKSELEKGVD